MENIHLAFLSFVLLGIIFVSGCTQQTGPAMIACLDYVELQDDFNSSNLVFAEYDYVTNTIMSSPFEISDYQVGNSIIKASSCSTDISLALVSKDYIVEYPLGVPAEGKTPGAGKTMPPSYGWLEGLTSNSGITAKAIRFGFEDIYKCRTDKHKE